MSDRLYRHWGSVGLLLMMACFWRFNGGEALLTVLGAAAVHELGHLTVLRLWGASAGSMEISAGGAVIRAKGLELSYLQEIAAVLAGPAANLLAGMLLSGVWGNSPRAAAWAGAHLALGIFNLLPAAPLDGWRILQLLLWWTLGPDTGYRAAALAGIAGSLLLAYGIFRVVILTGGNLWLIPIAVHIAAEGIKVAVREE